MKTKYIFISIFITLILLISNNVKAEYTENDIIYENCKFEYLEYKNIDGIECLVDYGIENNTVKKIKLLEKESLENEYELKFYEGNNEKIENDKICTGTIIKLINNNEIKKEFTYILYGDTTGDGKIDALDALTIIKNKLGIIEFTNKIYEEAGKMTETVKNSDKKPGAADALTIIKYKLDMNKSNLPKVYTFKNVEEMKKSLILKKGDICETLGYYEENDGGNGLYKIVDDENLNEDNGKIHYLKQNLKAKLVLEDNMINVKQYGAKGDGITDDTQAFENARKSYNCIYIPEATYLVKYFATNENAIIYGNNSTLNCTFKDTTIINTIRSNSKLYDLTINSLDEDREWNRIDITSKENVLLSNCTITGFKHNSSLPNAWGIYLHNSSNITISNCKFDNNSQSDIAIVEGCNNIIIDSCYGIQNNIHINIEPQGVTNNIQIKKSNIDILSILSNTDLYWDNQNILLEDNNISNLMLNGAIVSLINNKINEISTSKSLPFSNIILQNENSIEYENEELIKDMYFESIRLYSETKSDEYWRIGYTPSSILDMIEKTNDSEKGRILRLNPKNMNSCINISYSIQVDELSQYAIETLMNTRYIKGSSPSGRGMSIYFVNDENEYIAGYSCMIDRMDYNTNESAWNKKTIFITAPKESKKMNISISNYTGEWETYCTQWKYVSVKKLK